MNDKNIIVRFAMLVALGAFTSSADTVNLLRNSQNGFTQGTDWSGGKAPQSGNDYVVANGRFLCGDNSEPFDGDSLQFGVVGGTEGIFYKAHEGTHTFTRLILANGYYRTWMSSSGQAGHIAGNVEVLSTEAAPFRLHSTHTSGLAWYDTYWDATITGAKGTALSIGPYLLNTSSPAHLSSGRTFITGNNSGYLGSIYVYGTNHVLTINSGTALGGALDALKADALTLSDGTTLRCDGDFTLASSFNRGVTVNATGGKIDVADERSVRLEWPVTGSGTLAKVGLGALTLASEMSLSASTAFLAATGKVVFAEGFSNTGGGMVVIAPDAEISVPSGDDVEVSGLAIDGASLRIDYDSTTGTAGMLTLGAGSSVNGPIKVYPPDVREVTVPFLKVPLSAGTVTAADFVMPADIAVSGLPSATFEVQTVGEYQVVSAKTVPLVYVVDANPSTGAANDRAYFAYNNSHGWRWSEGKNPHAGADYSVGAGKTVYCNWISGDYVFLGESITFAGTIVGSTTTYAVFDLGNDDLTSFTGDIRCGNASQIQPKCRNGEFHLKGRLHAGSGAGATGTKGLDFRAQTNMTLVIDSVVTGSGYMSFEPSGENRTNTYYFTASNAFTGTYYVHSMKSGSRTTLKFATAESWGLDRIKKSDAGIALRGFAEMHPVGSQVVDHPNRGLQFYDQGPRVRVDDGAVFEFKNPIMLKNHTSRITTAEKVGGGTWAVGGAVTIDQGSLEDVPRLTVAEGYLRADNPRAFQSVNVTVNEGAGIAAKFRPGETSEVAAYGMIVTNAALFAVNGDTLKFKIATGGEMMRASDRVAILTVPEAAAAAIDAKAVILEHDYAYGDNAVLSRNSVTVSGIPSICYSCRFVVHGTMLIVR